MSRDLYATGAAIMTNRCLPHHKDLKKIVVPCQYPFHILPCSCYWTCLFVAVPFRRASARFPQPVSG